MVNNKDDTIKHVNWSSEKVIVKYMAVLYFSQWPLISHTTNRETIQRRQKCVRKISKENLTLESQQSQWQQDFHVPRTLCKSDATFTSSSGVNHGRENETLFPVCIKVRVPNLNKSKWKKTKYCLGPDHCSVTDDFAWVFKICPFFHFLLSSLPFVLFSPSFLPPLPLSSFPSLSFIKHFSSVHQMPDTSIYRQEDPVPALMKLTI